MFILDHSELKESLKAEKDVAVIVMRVISAITSDAENQIDSKPFMLKVLRAYREDAQAIADAAATGFGHKPKVEPTTVALKVVPKVVSKPVASKAKRR